MPKSTKGGFYAVKEGRKKGIFSTWDECEEQIQGYPSAKFKKFANAADAQRFINGKTIVSTPQEAGYSTAATASSKGKKRALDAVEDESTWDVVYSDGACKGNGKARSVAGIGVYWGPNDPRNIAERCPGTQTNNRAELIAIVRILETVPFSKKPLLIKTDSQYCKKCFEEWLPNWVKNDFISAQGQRVKNAGIIRYLASQLDARAMYGQPLRFGYVKGHSGDPGNDGADSMANQGARLPEVEDRDWDELEKALRAKTKRDAMGRNVKVAPIKIEVTGDDPVSHLAEIPSKIRRITSSLRPARAEGGDSISDRSRAESASQHTASQPSRTSKATSPRNRKPSVSTDVRTATFSTETARRSMKQLEGKGTMTMCSPPPANRTSAHSISRPTIGASSSPARSLSAETRETDHTRNNASGMQPSSSTLNHQRIQSFPPMKVICVMPPLIPAPKEDVDIELYADCILDDDDLAKELDE